MNAQDSAALNLTIQYLLPLYGEGDNIYSPFQGFSYGLLKSFDILIEILKLPANVFELFSAREQIISQKINYSSEYFILPFDQKIINFVPISISNPFVCIFSNEFTIDNVVKFVVDSQIPILHISTTNHKEAINLHSLNDKIIKNYINDVIEYLRPNLSPEIRLQLKDIITEKENDEYIELGISKKEHFVTLPGQHILSNLKYRFKGTEKIQDNTNIKYIEAIIDVANIISSERSKITERYNFPNGEGVESIITAPSMGLFFYKNWHPKKSANGEEKEFQQSVKMVLKALRKQNNFSLESTQRDFEKIFSSPAGPVLINTRREESAIYSIGVAIICSSIFASSVRLPPCINKIHNILNNIGQCARANNSSRYEEKLNKQCLVLQKKLTQLIDKKYFDFFLKIKGEVKLLTDAPLEWLKVDGIPLMLKNDTSKIPTTPGNLYFQQSINRTALHLTPSDFNNILIIRSFRPNDPIRNILETAINTLLNPVDTQQISDLSGKKSISINQSSPPFNLKVNFVDVKNKDDIIKHLNNYEGSLVIFDCHGSHEMKLEYGSLVLAEEKLNIWYLRGQVRIPPIVLLSACDTHPIDASHSSVANGFLAAGAVTVMASLLPIGSKESAMFIARLLLRIEQFLPIVVSKIGKPIRWTRIISGLQRMSYITEIMRMLLRKTKKQVDEDHYKKTMFSCNCEINPGHQEWFEKCIGHLATCLNLSVVEVKDYIYQWGQLPECLKYIQLGNPDLLIIKQNNADR